MNSQEKLLIFYLIRRLKEFLPIDVKLKFLFLIFLMFLSAFAEIVSIGMVVPFLTAITSPDLISSNSYIQPILFFFDITTDYKLLIFMTIIFCFAAVLAAFLRLVTLWFQIRLCYSTAAVLSTSIYNNTLHQSYSIHTSRNSSEFISTIISKTSASTSYAIIPILNILSSSLVITAIVLALILIEPLVAISVLGLFGLLYGSIIFLTKSKLNTDSQSISREQDQVIKKLQEGFGSIRDILISNTQKVFLKSYETSFFSLQKAWASVEIIKNVPRFIIEAIGIIILALLALFLSSQPNGILGSLPILGALAIAAQRLLPTLQLIYASISSLRAGLSSLSDVLDLLEEPTDELLIKAPNSHLPFKNKIELENLQFKYDSSGPLVLDGINLTIKKGDILGIIGSTGSGKSTLMDIIMGLLKPSSGRFVIDEIEVTDKNKYGWQSQLAHVPQSLFLSDSSILENIALGVPIEEIDTDLVIKSAKQAQIHKTISAWKDEYKTIVGERGVRISGGQRQRIGIARALYKKSSVIIFDEATSSLDSETEESVMQSIDRLDQDLTIIIIAHRLTTLKNCTNIIELSDGRIIRQDVYNKIINGETD